MDVVVIIDIIIVVTVTILTRIVKLIIVREKSWRLCLTSDAEVVAKIATIAIRVGRARRSKLLIVHNKLALGHRVLFADIGDGEKSTS